MAVKPQTVNPNPTGTGNGNGNRITAKKIQNSDADRLLGCGNGNGNGITAKKTTNQQNRLLLGCTADKEFGKSEPPNSFITKREEGTKNLAVKNKKSEKKSQTANPNPTGDRNRKSPNSTGDRLPITGRKKLFPIEGKGKTAAAKQPSSSSSSELKSSPILFITRKKKKKKITTNQQTSDLIDLDHLHGCTSDKEFEELELRIEKEMQRTRLTIGMQVNHFFELKSQWHDAKASKLSMRRKSTETKPPNNKKKITVDETTEKLSSNIKFRLRKKKLIISRGGLDDHGTDQRSNINSIIRSNTNKRGDCSQTSTSFQKRRRSSLVSNFDDDEDPSQERMAKVRKDDTSNVGSTSDNGVNHDTLGWSFVEEH